MNVIYDNHVTNELGTVSCELYSNIIVTPEIKVNENSISIKTQFHICELIRIEHKAECLPKGMSVEHSQGWLWTVKKLGSGKENLNLKCYLKPISEVSSYPDTGENLDALAIENDLKIMHIGTEDAEALYYRAKNSDYMPTRLTKELPNTDQHLDYTSYIENGFKTKIPDLLENEIVYFQYLYAINTRKNLSNQYEEENISTWYAVERERSFMLKELGLKFNN